MAGAIVAGVFLVGAGPVPTPKPSPLPCSDQNAVLLLKLEPLIAEYEEQRKVTSQTARMNLGEHIGKLRDLRKRTRELKEWSDLICEYPLRQTLEEAQTDDIVAFGDFHDQRRYVFHPKLWEDATRQLAMMRGSVDARKR